VRDLPQVQKLNSYKLGQVDGRSLVLGYGRILVEYGRYWLWPLYGPSNCQWLLLVPVSSPIFEGGGRS
jgi:hypothetical protein